MREEYEGFDIGSQEIHKDERPDIITNEEEWV